MFNSMYPFWSFVISVAIAQLAKPLWAVACGGKPNIRLIFASGGMPSSHTAGVAALCVSVGLQESFNSTVFAVTLELGLIVAYDAANVRYYAGKNIKLTKQIIKDLREENEIILDEPIYEEPIKEVLGHKWSEVIGGAILGIIIAGILRLI